jgi:hypothetical protein
MKTIHLNTQLPDAIVEGLEGKFLDSSAYDGQPVARDAVVYKPNGDVLFKLVRNALPLDLCKTAWKALRSVSADAAHRIVASGGAARKMNGVSAVVGFLNRTGRHGLDYCRLTSWSMGNPNRFAQAIPFFQAIDRVFQRHMPERHAAQMAKVRQTDPAFMIHRTAFTTVTVNKGFANAVSTDEAKISNEFDLSLFKNTPASLKVDAKAEEEKAAKALEAKVAAETACVIAMLAKRLEILKRK